MPSFHSARGAGRGLAAKYQRSVLQTIKKEKTAALADERAEKVARADSRFNLFDTNGDGAISKSELKEALTRIKRETTGDPHAEVCTESLKLIWGARLSCEKLDGQSLLKLINAYKNLLRDGSYHSAVS